MVTACLTGLQALEAAFRVLYPDTERTPLRKLIRRAQTEGILPASIAELADAGAELRNSFSHPRTQFALTVGAAAPMLENTHRLVALSCNLAGARTARERALWRRWAAYQGRRVDFLVRALPVQPDADTPTSCAATEPNPALDGT